MRLSLLDKKWLAAGTSHDQAERRTLGSIVVESQTVPLRAEMMPSVRARLEHRARPGRGDARPGGWAKHRNTELDARGNRRSSLATMLGNDSGRAENVWRAGGLVGDVSGRLRDAS